MLLTPHCLSAQTCGHFIIFSPVMKDSREEWQERPQSPSPLQFVLLRVSNDDLGDAITRTKTSHLRLQRLPNISNPSRHTHENEPSVLTQRWLDVHVPCTLHSSMSATNRSRGSWSKTLANMLHRKCPSHSLNGTMCHWRRSTFHQEWYFRRTKKHPASWNWNAMWENNNKAYLYTDPAAVAKDRMQGRLFSWRMHCTWIPKCSWWLPWIGKRRGLHQEELFHSQLLATGARYSTPLEEINEEEKNIELK